jgi:hypothetical protein
MSWLTAALLLLAAASAYAQDNCSLVVKAVLPDGRRVDAPVSVTEMNGRTEEQYQKDEDVKFCDLGIFPVTVKVGRDGLCNQVTVHNVPTDSEDTYLLQVTYDPLACGERPAPPPTPLCTVLFRVAGLKETWIPGAQITFSSPTGDRLTTDRYGRALFFVKRGTQISGSASAAGYKTNSFNWLCAEEKHEEAVTLSH